MSDKLVKRRVKGIKGLWLQGPNGVYCAAKDEEVTISEQTVKSKARHLYAPGEWEALEAGRAEMLKASQGEKDARNAPEEVAPPVKSAATPSKGSGSKES